MLPMTVGKKIPLMTTQWCVRHSPSTRPLARPPGEAFAAASRTHGHGSTHGQHPSRREHATVLVGVLCATNGTQHQQRHKHTTHSSEQPIFGSLMRARTRNDAWDHASPIVHARLATHRPHLPSKAQHCTMSGKALCSLPHTAASQHTREGLREQCVRHGPAHASASSESGHSARGSTPKAAICGATHARDSLPSLAR